MITGLPTAPLASRSIDQRAAAPWITRPRRASLIDSKILSKQTEPALRKTNDFREQSHFKTAEPTFCGCIYREVLESPKFSWKTRVQLDIPILYQL